MKVPRVTIAINGSARTSPNIDRRVVGMTSLQGDDRFLARSPLGAAQQNTGLSEPRDQRSPERALFPGPTKCHPPGRKHGLRIASWRRHDRPNAYPNNGHRRPHQSHRENISIKIVDNASRPAYIGRVLDIPPMRTSLTTKRLLNRLAMFCVATVAVFCAGQVEAGVVVSLDSSADGSLAAPVAAPSSPTSSTDNDVTARRQLLASLLASSPAGGATGTSSGPATSGGASSSALADPICHLPQPTLAAWLDLGQYLALPSLPPSGLFRPPCAG